MHNSCASIKEQTPPGFALHQKGSVSARRSRARKEMLINSILVFVQWVCNWLHASWIMYCRFFDLWFPHLGITCRGFNKQFIMTAKRFVLQKLTKQAFLIWQLYNSVIFASFSWPRYVKADCLVNPPLCINLTLACPYNLKLYDEYLFH